MMMMMTDHVLLATSVTPPPVSNRVSSCELPVVSGSPAAPAIIGSSNAGVPVDGSNEIESQPQKIIMGNFAQRPQNISVCTIIKCVKNLGAPTLQIKDLHCRSINPSSIM